MSRYDAPNPNAQTRALALAKRLGTGDQEQDSVLLSIASWLNIGTEADRAIQLLGKCLSALAFSMLLLHANRPVLSSRPSLDKTGQRSLFIILHEADLAIKNEVQYINTRDRQKSEEVSKSLRQSSLDKVWCIVGTLCS